MSFLQRFRITTISGILFTLVIAFYGRTIEPYSPEKVVVPLRFNNEALYAGSLPLTVLHLSDLHVCDEASVELLEDAIKMGLESKPDIIFLTGDFITRHLLCREGYVTALKKLSAFAPAYACLGNHDGGRWSGSHFGEADTDEICTLLKDSDITCLINEAVDCEVKGINLHIVGLGDLWSGDFSPSERLFQAPLEDYFTIVISHNPDTKPVLERYKWNLMLSGHTHGGQMDIPLIDNVYVPISHKEYTSGLHYSDNRYLYVTCGVGCTVWFRLNRPPEVTILELR